MIQLQTEQCIEVWSTRTCLVQSTRSTRVDAWDGSAMLSFGIGIICGSLYALLLGFKLRLNVESMLYSAISITCHYPSVLRAVRAPIVSKFLLVIVPIFRLMALKLHQCATSGLDHQSSTKPNTNT